jgi:pSer/pThr/pTyr-binding forkhead associated (FHA) protein
MQAKLVVVQPALQPGEYEVTLPVTIGRGHEAGLQLPYALISREHCELFEDRGRLFVRDLNSLNGTFVGGQRIDTSPLHAGELLTIGTVTLRAVYGDDALPMSTAVDKKLLAEMETVAVEETAQVSPRPREEPAGEPLGHSDDGRSDFFKPSDN